MSDAKPGKWAGSCHIDFFGGTSHNTILYRCEECDEILQAAHWGKGKRTVAKPLFVHASTGRVECPEVEAP